MRGCAFVTMANRIDADKAYRRLRNRKLSGYDIKVSAEIDAFLSKMFFFVLPGRKA